MLKKPKFKCFGVIYINMTLILKTFILYELTFFLIIHQENIFNSLRTISLSNVIFAY